MESISIWAAGILSVRGVVNERRSDIDYLCVYNGAMLGRGDRRVLFGGLVICARRLARAPARHFRALHPTGARRQRTPRDLFRSHMSHGRVAV